MKKFWFVCSVLALSACNSKSEPSPQASEASQDVESAEGASANEASGFTLPELLASLQARLQSGDSAACTEALVSQRVVDTIRPKYPDERGQRHLLAVGRIAPEDVVTPEQWSETVGGYGSLNQTIMTGFNNQTKQMVCQTMFRIDENSHFPVQYAIQPSADHTDVMVNVNSPALGAVTQQQISIEILKRARRDFATTKHAGNDRLSANADLIKEYFSQDELCFNGNDEACQKRDDAMNRLNDAGICYGENDQPNSDYKMHECRANSIR